MRHEKQLDNKVLLDNARAYTITSIMVLSSLYTYGVEYLKFTSRGFCYLALIVLDDFNRVASLSLDGLSVACLGISYNTPN